jgi:hypothetical protein
VIAAVAAAGGQGLAADLAPPRVAYVPAFTWAGIYAGAHLGYNFFKYRGRLEIVSRENLPAAPREKLG